MSVNGHRLSKHHPAASTPPQLAPPQLAPPSSHLADYDVVELRSPALPDVEPVPPVTPEPGWTEQSGFYAGLVIGVIATIALIMATMAVATAFRRVL